MVINMGILLNQRLMRRISILSVLCLGSTVQFTWISLGNHARMLIFPTCSPTPTTSSTTPTSFYQAHNSFSPQTKK